MANKFVKIGVGMSLTKLVARNAKIAFMPWKSLWCAEIRIYSFFQIGALPKRTSV